MKKSRKGFTLVELIIVLAIFSIIMFSVVQLLDPVSKFFVRSSNFENTTAGVDNMRRCIEGNLKYVDRVRVYEGFMPYTVSPLDSSVNSAPAPSKDGSGTSMYDTVGKFYEYYFSNRKFIDTSGSIFVLVFDNTRQISDTALSSFGTLTDFATSYGNSGRIVQFEFKFDNYDTHLDDWDEVWNSCVATPWVVNQKLYGAFEYEFTLGDIDDSSLTTSTSGSEELKDEWGHKVSFNPQNFTITILSNEIRRQDGGLVRMLSTDKNTSSFAMKNVLDGTKKFASPLMDNKTLCLDETADPQVYTVEKKTRYANVNRNPATDVLDVEHPGGTKFDGFYFIYTLPENIHTNSTYYKDT
jgi:prepilin-type N-terminal cleavage/methylation domain-containing protein